MIHNTSYNKARKQKIKFESSKWFQGLFVCFLDHFVVFHWFIPLKVTPRLQCSLSFSFSIFVGRISIRSRQFIMSTPQKNLIWDYAKLSLGSTSRIKHLPDSWNTTCQSVCLQLTELCWNKTPSEKISIWARNDHNKR